MKELTELVAPLVDEMGRKTLEEKGGVHFYDGMGEYGTTLRPDRACACVVFDELGRASCGIEKLYGAWEIAFRKPISCFLYTITCSRTFGTGFVALNSEDWDMCTT